MEQEVCKTLNFSPEEARQKAEDLFAQGYNCAQSVAAVFSEELGIPQKTMLKLAQPFGGGMGRMREVCGCVSGMFLALGLINGSDDSQDKASKTECYDNTQKLAEEFRKQNGSIICRELLGLVPMGQSENALKNHTQIEHVIQPPQSEERTPEYYKKRPCKQLVGDAAYILCDWINNSKKIK